MTPVWEISLQSRLGVSSQGEQLLKKACISARVLLFFHGRALELGVKSVLGQL
jgi:hypothetical protein